MSSKTVLSVGQCRPDTAAIHQFLTSNFDVQVITADLPDESLRTLQENKIDLVLINRKLDADSSDGLLILKSMKTHAAMSQIPVMLVSNFPEWQEKAVEHGAVYGFGKAELNLSETVDKVRAVLEA